MTALSRRQLTTALTLTVLVIVLCLMAIFGYRAATQPLPSANDAVTTNTCTKDEVTKQRYVRPRDLTVSVYNAGASSGAAGRLMHDLEDHGFHPGEVANAPAGKKVGRAQVHTTKAHVAGARLVARTLGKGVKVVVSNSAGGPGIDVYVGRRFHHLAPHPPKKLKLAKPIVTCVQVG